MTSSNTGERPMGIEMMAPVDSPEGWERELRWRMRQAAPEYTARGWFFNGTLAAVRTLGSEEAVRACVEVAGEVKFVDSFNYPIRSFLRVLGCALRQLAPGLGGEEVALRELGRLTQGDFLSTTMGRTVVMLAYGSPRRMMESMPDIYRQSLGFGEHSVVWTGLSSGRFVLRGDFLPYPCHEGMLEALLQVVGGPQVRVERRWVNGLDGEYAFSWE